MKQTNNETGVKSDLIEYRKNVENLSNKELSLLRKDFTVFDTTGFHPLVGTYNNYAWHGARNIDGLAQVQLFLPWNRAFLQHFQITLLKFEKSLPLPFWDWNTTKTGIPNAFTPKLIDKQINPLYEGQLPEIEKPKMKQMLKLKSTPEHTFRSPGELSSFPRFDLTQLLQISDFSNFSHALITFSSEVHVWVGGSMATTKYAAFDPIFWFHLCNVDRIWWLWQQENGIQNIPQEYLGMALEPFEYKVKQVLDIFELGYDYAEESTKTFSADILKIEGPSTVVATDSWTTNDKLGYWVFASAIYRFLTFENTKPPVTISIQAQWGGGKTSLMKMVQKQLDPIKVEIDKGGKQKKNEKIEQDQYDEIKSDLIDLAPDAWKKVLMMAGNIEYNILTKSEREEKRKPPEKQKELQKRCFTVWFNAWKYQGNETIWAGLAHSMIKQISERLSPVDQKKFWLKVNGYNTKKDIQDKIKNSVKEAVKPILIRWISASLAAIGVSIGVIITTMPMTTVTSEYGLVGGAVGIIGSVVTGIWRNFIKYSDEKSKQTKKVQEESKNPYLHIPDYTAKLGIEHRVEEDLKRVVKALPPEHKPLVIFIDDLDRCPPNEVAGLIEVLNRITALDLGCNFILGMDAELVSAALEVEYFKVIKQIPKYAQDVPIGWRFMDKFVQLPIILPKPDDVDLTFFLSSLQVSKEKKVREKIQFGITSLAAKSTSKTEIENNVSQYVKDQKLSEPAEKEITYNIRQSNILSKTKDQYSEDEKLISNLSKKIGLDFSKNPRDLKRFTNLYRLLKFVQILRKARKEDGEDIEIAEDDHLTKWIHLALKWPYLIRWIVRGSDDVGYLVNYKEHDKTIEPFQRLALLEWMANDCIDNSKNQDKEKWQKNLMRILRISKIEDAPWIVDVKIYDFFKDTELKLSDLCGRGLY